MEQLSHIFPNSVSASAEPMQPIELPRADLVALQNNAKLVPGQIYIANDIDWVIAGGVSKFAVMPDAVDKLPSTGRYLAGDFTQKSWWEGNMDWANGLVIRLADTDNLNYVYGATTVQNYPFNQSRVYNNHVVDAAVSVTDNANFLSNRINRGSITLSGNARMINNDCNGDVTQVTMSSGTLSYSTIDRATVNITGTGSVTRSTLSNAASATLAGSGSVTNSTLDKGSVSLTNLSIQECIIQTNTSIQAQGSSGLIYRSRFFSCATINIPNITNATIYLSYFNDATINCSGAEQLFLYRVKFDNLGSLYVNNNASIQSYYSQVINGGGINITKGKLMLTYVSASNVGSITQNTDFINRINYCSLSSHARLGFNGNAKENLINYCNLAAHSWVIFQGTTENCSLYSNNIVSDSIVTLQDSIKVSLSYVEMNSQSHLFINNAEDTSSVQEVSLTSGSHFQIIDMQANARIRKVAASSDATLKATDHAGFIYGCSASSGYTLELGNNAQKNCMYVSASGNGSASVNRNADTYGAASKNF